MACSSKVKGTPCSARGLSPPLAFPQGWREMNGEGPGGGPYMGMVAHMYGGCHSMVARGDAGMIPPSGPLHMEGSYDMRAYGPIFAGRL